MRKKITLMLIISLLLSTSNFVHANEKEIPIIIDGVAQQFDAKPVKVNGSVLVPMRAIFELLDSEVNYDVKTKVITAKKGSKIIVLTVDSEDVHINDKLHKLTIAPQVINSKTMVPLRFVGEALGADVLWDPSSQSVNIKSDPTKIIAKNEETAKDELLIEELIKKRIHYHNTLDGTGYYSLLYKPKETIEYMESGFKNYKNDEFILESVSDIKVDGDEASARYSEIIKKYSYLNSTKYTAATLKYDLIAYLAKIDGEWLFVRFERVGYEQLPHENEFLETN